MQAPGLPGRLKKDLNRSLAVILNDRRPVPGDDAAVEIGPGSAISGAPKPAYTPSPTDAIPGREKDAAMA